MIVSSGFTVHGDNLVVKPFCAIPETLSSLDPMCPETIFIVYWKGKISVCRHPTRRNTFRGITATHCEAWYTGMEEEGDRVGRKDAIGCFAFPLLGGKRVICGCHDIKNDQMTHTK